VSSETTGRQRPPESSHRGSGKRRKTNARAFAAARLATPVREDHRFSRAGWLAGILRERVIDGTYAPGERIREAALQEEFGFSNGPIREALQRLVADGLAQRAPWQGVRVVALGEREIVDLFELRGALLEYAAERAAQRADDAAVRSAATLRKTLAGKFAAAREGHPPPVTGATTDWVLQVAGNPQITAVWRATMLKSRVYVYRAMKRTAGARTAPIIEELIRSILARKPSAARKAARDLTRQMLADAGIEPGRAADEGPR
jgi:DNA-binding GntR family transcriptional regulator